MPELLSAADVAAEIGCDPSTIRRRAASNGIGQQIAGGWVFTRAEVKKLEKLISPGTAGNPHMGKDFQQQYRGGRKRSAK